MAARYLKLHIDDTLAGAEVNTLLRRHFMLSGTVLRRIKWLEDGITVDGRRVNVRYRVSRGELLRIRLTDPTLSSGIVPAEGPLDIVYEDEDIAVINKAPGVPVHPGHGHFNDTVGNFLLRHYQKNGEESDFHPVHRLDKGTTGLLVVAKHPHGQERLKLQLHSGDFRRRYLAVCEGTPVPPQGLIDTPIRPVPGSLIAREVHPDGQQARTHYRTVKSFPQRTLVELELETGRTHQIRVHMAHIGCPLTGDFLYGTENRALIARPALHSAALDIIHPITGQPLHFELPVPDDMAQLLSE